MADKPLDWQMQQDAKHLGFVLARYHNVAQLFSGFEEVLEVGCGNGFGAQVVKQAVGRLQTVDLPAFDLSSREWPLAGFNAVYCLDVIEHIEPEFEHIALRNLSRCAPVCIIGTPTLESQPYASPESKRLHVNCFTGERLRDACRAHWRHVFMLCMTDSTTFVGDFRMARYLMAICTGPL